MRTRIAIAWQQTPQSWQWIRMVWLHVRFCSRGRSELMMPRDVEGSFKLTEGGNSQKRQSRERLMFALLLSTAALTLQPPARSLWVKQRSSYWWEQEVNTTCTPYDWTENFRMSHETFLFLCNELRASIERNDTVMRKAIPVEQRVALMI